jgi:hypothetical protein
LLLLISCKTTQPNKNSIPPAISIAVNEVYKSILDYEFKKEIKTNLVSIVDRATEKTNISQYNKFVKNDSIEVLNWNRQLYPRANYVDGRLVYIYKNQNPEKYLDLINKNNGYGWYELWIPSFTSDRKEAIIDVKFHFAKPNDKSYFTFFQAYFKWENGRYKYTGRNIINSSKK